MNRAATQIVLALEGEDARSMSVGPDRTKVYVGFFDSGNEATILGTHGQCCAVTDPAGPHGSQNPPPNDGVNLKPAINPILTLAPTPSGVIVRKNAATAWMDDSDGLDGELRKDGVETIAPLSSNRRKLKNQGRPGASPPALLRAALQYAASFLGFVQLVSITMLLKRFRDRFRRGNRGRCFAKGAYGEGRGRGGSRDPAGSACPDLLPQFRGLPLYHAPQEASQSMRAGADGFTLLELLVVVAIIALLAGYVAPRYFGQIGKSEVNTAKAQIDALEKALDQYRLDTGRYPTTELGLNALVTKPPNEPKWSGPYLRKAVPFDPWGKPYVYLSPGEKGDVDLVSYGKDGVPGGTGENADITNR